MKKGKDGRYHKYFRKDGQRYHVAADSEPELYMKVGKLLQQLETDTYKLDKNTLVRDWAKLWLSTYKEGKITKKSLDTYRQKLDGYILPEIGNMKLKDVTSVHLQRILNQQAGKSYSHLTKLRVTMSGLFERAVIARLIVFNPAQGLELPAYEKGQRRSLTGEERDAVLAVAASNRAGLWVKMMLYCGLRNGETRALQWKDIDLKEGIVHVRAAAEGGTGEIKGPKTEAGVRDVPIRSAFLEELKAAQKGRSPFDYVFTQASSRRRHTERSMNQMWAQFKRLVDIEMAERKLQAIAEETSAAKQKAMVRQLDLGLPESKILQRIRDGNLSATHQNKVVVHGESADLLGSLTPYCLRHTYCTDLQRAGVSLNVAKYLMGHSDISVTANIYTHTTDDVILDAAQKLETLAN